MAKNIPSKNHPWNVSKTNSDKLKAARKEAMRRYERKYYAESEIRQRQCRKAARNSRGLPENLDPSVKMKPWDYKKGRMMQTEK